MRSKLLRTTLGLLPIALPLACGSLNEGEIVIADEPGAGTGGSVGGADAKAGSSTAGGSSGNASGGKGGGSSGDSGEAGVGTGATGGSSNGGNGGNGGSSGKGGTGAASGDAGSGGGGGELPTGCTEISECAGGKPICDDGTCRACVPPTGMEANECAELTDTPHCEGSSGRCVECGDNSHCGDARPICDENACRICRAGSECDSGACTAKGRCALETNIVYVSDQGTSDVMSCGTRAKPCDNPTVGAQLLGSARPFMVILYTSRGFETTFTLPANSDVAVFGNGTTLYATDAPVILMSGGTVLLDDLDIKTSGTLAGAPGLSAVDCSGANLKVVRSAISNPGTSNVGLNLKGCTADIRQTTFSENQNGVVSYSTTNPPSQALTIERSIFKKNRQAIDFNGASFVIRNNLFLDNGLQDLVKIIALSSVAPSVFAYNTSYGNDDGCVPGALVYCTTAGDGCGTHSSNLFWGNMFNSHPGATTTCPEQVYNPAMLPTSISYTIAEAQWVGVGNSALNPRLTDPTNGDYTPSSSSAAIGKGDTDPNVMPLVDFYGNPRDDYPDIGAIEVQ